MLKKKLKILRIFSRLNIGGPSYHVINLTDGLKDYNYETKLVVGQCAPWEGDLSFYAREKKVSPVVLPCFSYRISPLNDVITFFQLLFIILKEKPDVVHTHTFKAGALGRVAAFLGRTPVIVHTYHGHLLNNYWSGWKIFTLKSIEKALGALSDVCIGVSHQVSSDLINAGVVKKEKMKTVELGFDFNYLNHEMQSPSTLRKMLHIDRNQFVFGTACRLVPIKDIELLLRASVPALLETNNSHLVIVGQGPEKEFLIQLMHELTLSHEQIKSRIHFMNWITPFQRELKDFNLYICSSKNEGTSVSVIEAMIAKVPVISTSVGGMPDLLEHGKSGILLKTNGTDELTNEIVKAYDLFQNGKSSDVDLHALKLKTQVRFGEARLSQEIDRIYADCFKAKGLQLERQ